MGGWLGEWVGGWVSVCMHGCVCVGGHIHPPHPSPMTHITFRELYFI